MYSLRGYGEMLADRVRMNAYGEALRKSVKPGSVVVDLGAGPCIMSCLALQLGAAKVIAIDPSDTLEVGRMIARINGLENQIDFHHASSNSVNVQERADVVVADLRGVLPAFTGNFGAVADARERFLKPGGTLIPQRDSLWLALAEAPTEYSAFLEGWTFEGLDLSIGRRMVANTWGKSKAPVTADQLLTTPVKWSEIDYRTVTEFSISGLVEAEVLQPGTAHGFVVWFDTELLDGIGFSNAPGLPQTIYGRAFFPLLDPIAVERSDRMELAIRADLVGDDYTWCWNTLIRSAYGVLKASYRQSTFFGVPLSAHTLRKSTHIYIPKPTPDALIDSAVLHLFGSGLNLQDIATKIASRFPARFSDWKAALDHVAALCLRYSE